MSHQDRMIMRVDSDMAEDDASRMDSPESHDDGIMVIESISDEDYKRINVTTDSNVPEQSPSLRPDEIIDIHDSDEDCMENDTSYNSSANGSASTYRNNNNATTPKRKRNQTKADVYNNVTLTQYLHLLDSLGDVEKHLTDIQRPITTSFSHPIFLTQDNDKESIERDTSYNNLAQGSNITYRKNNNAPNLNRKRNLKKAKINADVRVSQLLNLFDSLKNVDKRLKNIRNTIITSVSHVIDLTLDNDEDSIEEHTSWNSSANKSTSTYHNNADAIADARNNNVIQNESQTEIDNNTVSLLRESMSVAVDIPNLSTQNSGRHETPNRVKAKITRKSKVTKKKIKKPRVLTDIQALCRTLGRHYRNNCSEQSDDGNSETEEIADTSAEE